MRAVFQWRSICTKRSRKYPLTITPAVTGCIRAFMLFTTNRQPTIWMSQQKFSLIRPMLVFSFFPSSIQRCVGTALVASSALRGTEEMQGSNRGEYICTHVTWRQREWKCSLSPRAGCASKGCERGSVMAQYQHVCAWHLKPRGTRNSVFSRSRGFLHETCEVYLHRAEASWLGNRHEQWHQRFMTWKKSPKHATRTDTKWQFNVLHIIHVLIWIMTFPIDIRCQVMTVAKGGSGFVDLIHHEDKRYEIYTLRETAFIKPLISIFYGIASD